MPTLVVKGLSETPQIQEVADLYAEGISDAHLLELPDTGHLPSVERPGELTAALSGFLDKLPHRPWAARSETQESSRVRPG